MSFTQETIREKHRLQIEELLQMNYDVNVIVIGRKDCKKCSKPLPKKKLKYEARHQRLPFNNCPMVKIGYKFCSASYGFEIL